MRSALVYSSELDAYRLSPGHPLRPERAALTVGLVSEYGMLGTGSLELVAPRSATREDLERVHDPVYVNAVMEAGSNPSVWRGGWGIGAGDTPPFRDMHDAAALVCGATADAISLVLSGAYDNAFSVSGGLHHAHTARASGFCVYNDLAVGIAAAKARNRDLRIFYLDFDAHHGDGVQEVFYDDPRVFTLSIHENGRFLFPSTGFTEERGTGAGAGCALNVPLPPQATDDCYLLVFDQLIRPAVARFAPDIIVAQCGADAHHADPLTSLGMTISGYAQLYSALMDLAQKTCGGRIVTTGGGGYDWASVVPRTWTLLASALSGIPLPDELPERWRMHVQSLGTEPPLHLREDAGPTLKPEVREWLLEETRRILEELSHPDG